MKLKRATDYKWLSSSGLSTVGRWRSADNRFHFRRTFLGWKISVMLQGFDATPEQTAQLKKDADAVRTHGLDKAYFKTRRDAVAALDAVLAAFGEKS